MRPRELVYEYAGEQDREQRRSRLQAARAKDQEHQHAGTHPRPGSELTPVESADRDQTEDRPDAGQQPQRVVTSRQTPKARA